HIRSSYDGPEVDTRCSAGHASHVGTGCTVAPHDAIGARRRRCSGCSCFEAGGHATGGNVVASRFGR
ncbi:MAG: hypothetical protein AAAB14_08855, partial [Ensifer adhaerens]